MKLLEKISSNKRLDFEDGIELYDLDLYTLGEFANKKREFLHEKKVYFNVNRHVNPTNVCKDICKFCAFSANRKNPNPYTLTHDEILTTVEKSVKNNITEVHIVSAHNPNVTLQWYMDIFRKIKDRFPHLHIKALTAAEIHFLSEQHNLSHDDIINLMIDSGIDSMPGGGAEIFDEEVRSYICKGKIDSKGWLEIHKKWHEKGRESNATMLFGHVEKREHRIDHILRLRDLQDQTGGFNAFIPLVYQHDNNYLNIKEHLSSIEILKTFAVARLLFDNIRHIKAYWATSTMQLAIVAQAFGANDLDGTIEKESIQSAAGASSAHGKSLKDIVDYIQTSGYIAVERDSLYNEIKIY